MSTTYSLSNTTWTSFSKTSVTKACKINKNIYIWYFHEYRRQTETENSIPELNRPIFQNAEYLFCIFKTASKFNYILFEIFTSINYVHDIDLRQIT